MEPGAQFDWHTHDDDQLAWASRGVLTVLTDTATWLLPRSRALWIPAGARHEVRAQDAAVMRSLYVKTGLLSIGWKTPTVVRARPLLAELIEYLGDETLDSARHERAAALLVDLLEPLARHDDRGAHACRWPRIVGRRGAAPAPGREPDADVVGATGGRQRTHAGTGIPLRNGSSFQQVAHARAAQGVTAHARIRAVDQSRRTRGRIRVRPAHSSLRFIARSGSRRRPTSERNRPPAPRRRVERGYTSVLMRSSSLS